jgi:hypothetical protein
MRYCWCWTSRETLPGLRLDGLLDFIPAGCERPDVGLTLAVAVPGVTRYTGGTLIKMATSHPRIQVTEDPELTRALRAAAPHLPRGLSRARQVHELAIAGARHLAEEPLSEERREALLEDLVESFMKPETAGIDWDLLRNGKLRAWPIR